MNNLYPHDFEVKIGFDGVRRALSDLCSSGLGRDNVDAMEFMVSYDDVIHSLRCVNEMTGIIQTGIGYPAPSTHDVLPYLSEIRANNSFISATHLYELLQCILSFAEINEFFSKKDGEGGSGLLYPSLASELSGISCFPALASVISNAVNKFGEIKDTASPELYEIRQAIKQSAGTMQRRMRAVIEKAVRLGIVDKDVTPSMRDGRMVIPVSAGNKRELIGIIHDESATGKTVFIEPAEVVEAGDRIRELEMDEKREETRILISIADILRPHIEDIIVSCRLAGRYDFIIAKAKYAIEIAAQFPHISDNPELEWYHARHPGLMMSLKAIGKEVVPLDLTLDSAHRILIISGPNAGGKSVTLKTVAIVQYMMQCGLLPTLYDNSHMGLFRELMIDIGDEQSIENELSTYSSHLRNMKWFVSRAGKRTLFLADEMGSGTEPQIGGAIAQAILRQLGESGAYGIVTTHYQNLKTFADNTPGFVNGAMLYDRQHLQPLFRLEVGNPGSSFALDIAYKMGLPRNVIEEAKEIVGSDYVNIDKYLSDIARDKRYWNQQRQRIREKQNKIDQILEKYESETTDLKSRRHEIIDDARREAKEIIESLNAKIERTILEIRKSQAEKERTKQLRGELREYTEDIVKDNHNDKSGIIRNLKPRKSKKEKTNTDKRTKEAVKTSEDIRPLGIGDYVTLEGNPTVGTILSIDKNKAEVAFGALRTLVDIKRLTRGKKPKQELTATSGVISSDDSRRRQLNFKQDIDVRGMRADEALQAVTYFLDDAVQFNAGRVRILHGTGHGILKTLIRQQLKANKAVVHFEDEDIRFGGAGITVVDLD